MTHRISPHVALPGIPAPIMPPGTGKTNTQALVGPNGMPESETVYPTALETLEGMAAAAVRLLLERDLALLRAAGEGAVAENFAVAAEVREARDRVARIACALLARAGT